MSIKNKTTATTDPEIRAALHQKRLSHYHQSDYAMVIDELCAYRKWRKDPGNRIDIAVVNGCLQGIEIKSSTDNLKRLPAQFETYRLCFEKITVVTAPKHLPELELSLPSWCGIVVAEKGARGAIHFNTLNRAKKNPEVDALAMTHFLWRQELIDCLKLCGVNRRSLKGRKRLLRQRLAKLISVPELSVFIRTAFLARVDWRAR